MQRIHPEITVDASYRSSILIIQGKFMRNLATQTAVLGLLALTAMLSGCGSSTPATLTAADGTWESALIGPGSGGAVFNFITSFSVDGTGGLSISYISFLTTGPCFPISGNTAGGTFAVTATGTTPTADFAFTVQSGGSTLALTGTATGATDTSGTTTWSSITGTWTLTGGDPCTGSGTFTMKRTGG
jgi:hypothetical protein